MKKRVPLIILLSLLFAIFSCKKETELSPWLLLDPLQVSIEVDSIVYLDRGADIYYHVNVARGQNPYSFQWTYPAENTDGGSFVTKAFHNALFSAKVNDCAGHETTAQWYYDYQEKLVGNYLVSHRSSAYGAYGTHDTTYTDTLEVIHYDSTLILVLGDIFEPDSSWRYGDFYSPGGHHIISVVFKPWVDSIEAYTMDGGLGGGFNNYYKGVKIN
ncbi:MAG: hypothetical protein KKD31_03525 [Bacteroidetes bacterium]|nr:hypothetical protein [Bacteroidota bacterium]